MRTNTFANFMKWDGSSATPAGPGRGARPERSGAKTHSSNLDPSPDVTPRHMSPLLNSTKV